MTNRHLGLCLAGGGITGAMYEVGVMAALEEAFEDFSANDFDVYVGAASGSVVATGLAAGISAQRMYRALLDPMDDFFPLQRQHLVRLDPKELQRAAFSVVGAVRRMLGSVTSKPLAVDVWNEVDRFWDSLPAGLFTTDPFEQFFFDFLVRRGLPKAFPEMPRRLLLVANDLDDGARVTFGLGGDLEHVPIAKAIAASMASPILFAPVRIDGRDFVGGSPGEAGHADVAVAQGCDTVLIVNPMVPLKVDPLQREVPTGHGQRKRVRDKGLLWVYSQSWRIVTEARLQKGLAAYRDAHPEVDIHLIEPDRSNATMFMHSPMNFAARRAILEDGYRATLTLLRDEDHPLRRSLVAAGFKPKPTVA
ncbi:MAG: patatin-like phospholipase family protein [Myxococcales bacterium]|nr:patatin-like phospholipase family protein [Myxococcales bacterium]